MTTAVYVFVGSAPSHMMGVFSMREFGQRIALTEEQAKDAVLGGSALVKAEEFDALGVTAEEQRKYGPFGAHETAPAEFTAKRKAALLAVHALREELAGPEEGK